MMFCWHREAVSNSPPSLGGESIPRDEVFACRISFGRAEPKTDGNCSSWYPSSDEFWKLPLPCPHHDFPPLSGESEADGQLGTGLERIGAPTHRGTWEHRWRWSPGSELPRSGVPDVSEGCAAPASFRRDLLPPGSACVPLLLLPPPAPHPCPLHWAQSRGLFTRKKTVKALSCTH